MRGFVLVPSRALRRTVSARSMAHAAFVALTATPVSCTFAPVPQSEPLEQAPPVVVPVAAGFNPVGAPASVSGDDVGANAQRCQPEKLHIDNVQKEDLRALLLGPGDHRILGSLACFTTPCGAQYLSHVMPLRFRSLKDARILAPH